MAFFLDCWYFDLGLPVSPAISTALCSVDYLKPCTHSFPWLFCLSQFPTSSLESMMNTNYVLIYKNSTLILRNALKCSISTGNMKMNSDDLFFKKSRTGHSDYDQILNRNKLKSHFIWLFPLKKFKNELLECVRYAVKQQTLISHLS